MGANVDAITNRIIAVLRDANGDSWPEASVQDAILEAERMVTIFKPDATAVDLEFTCVAGIRQSLSALTDPPAHSLLTLKYNVDASGNPGRSIRRVAVGDVDAIRPDWRTASEASAIREFIFDEREPLIFYTNPPVVVGTKARLSYSAVPAAYGTVTSETETTVSDIYEPMLIEWALYRLFGHDAEQSVNVARSQQHLQTFGNMMGVKMEAIKAAGPKNMEHNR